MKQRVPSSAAESMLALKRVVHKAWPIVIIELIL